MRSFPRRVKILLLLTLAPALLLPGAAMAQDEDPLPNERGSEVPTKAQNDTEAVPGQIIVKFRENAAPSVRADARREEGLTKVKDLKLINAEVDRVRGQSVEQAIRSLERRPAVEYAEPDFIVHPTAYTDEPHFGALWGLDNTGQTVNGTPGTADVDVNGKEAATVTQGDSNLVVAVIDDGVDFSHPDLANRAWTNPGEVPNNNVDDDSNGKVDDVNGWDFYHDDNTVHDVGADFHGTHVAGTIAASVNGQGVVGVAPNIKIMALKFLGPKGGSTSDAILAIAYAKSKGAKLSNNSWGGGAFSQALKDAIDASGSLFVAAAGNGGSDRVGDNNDTTPHYPSSYTSPNILAVAALNSQGNLASFSNFGPNSVDVSGPGVSILSSIPGTPAGQSAVTLSSVGSSGKAVTAGFGADEIGDAAKRTSFFTKAFQAVGRGSQNVVLVDDDASDSPWGLPDVGATISSAIQSSTGVAPQEIDVPYRSDGPNLTQLQGKTVVWATGRAYLSDDDGFFITKTTLTGPDQQTLINFLNGGGKLVLNGMDALFLIENSLLVSKTLKIGVYTDVPGKTTFEGSPGTAFAGESYALNSSTSNSNFHDVLVPGGAQAATQGVYPGALAAPAGWAYLNGTSMATPHATGVAALAASVNPALLSNPVGLKDLVMNTGKAAPATSGKTVTGDIVDAKAAVDASIPPDTTITSGPSGTLNSASATFEFSSNEAPSTFECKLDEGSWESCSSPKSYSALPDGPHTFSVRAIDAAAIVDPTPAERSWNIDTTPPNTSITSGPSGTTKSTSASFGFSSTEAGSRFQCSLDGSSFGACTSPKSYTGLSNGKHTFRVRAIDAAGNVDTTPAARTWTVDTIKPTISGISPTAGSSITDTTPTIRATVKDNLTNLQKSNIQLFVNGVLVPASKYSYNATTDELVYNSPALSKGKKTVKIVATDKATNVGTLSWSFTIV